MTPTISAVLNNLWQTAGVTGLAALAAICLRHNSARVRYWVWAAALAKFMVPFSVLVWLGNHVHWRTLQLPKPSSAPVFFAEVALPFTNTTPMVSSPSSGPNIVEVGLLAVWAVGFACVVLTCWLRWRQVRATALEGEMLPLNFPIPAISCATTMEPGVFGVFRPVLLLPAKLLNELTASQLEAVIAHELCHVKRRDNLVALLQMAVESIWWFNPLVWWVGRQMRNERERAADEHVLRVTGNPHGYAECILKVCRLCLESPVACVSGISGSNLRKRIESILHGQEPREVRLVNRVFLYVLGVFTFAVPLAIGIANSTPLHAQTPQESPSKPTFEVATIKPSQPGTAAVPSIGISADRMTFTSFTLKEVMGYAYWVHSSQILGTSGWMDSDKFDIVAKPEKESAPENLFRVTEEVRRKMVQTLLAERFRLKLHHDTKEMQAYVLSVAKDGPKMKARTPGDGGPGFRMMPQGSSLPGRNSSMTYLAFVLQAVIMDRPVVDKTGLTGNFDFDLSWRPDETQFGGRGGKMAADPDSPDLITAMREQLGLKLGSEKLPVDVLVIDQAEKPSEN